MVITPKISNDASAGTQNDPAQLAKLHGRHKSGSNGHAVEETVESAAAQSLNPSNAATNAAYISATEPEDDVTDSNAADALMASLRPAISGQPGNAMLAQANLSPQSAYDLLQ
jgi:hypothetical protein